MFASRNNPGYLPLLIFFSMVACVSYTQAQEQAAETGEQQARDASESRRIERLGEVTTDEWEMSLAVPSTAAAEAVDHADLALPDEAQDRELQRLLSRLAGDPANATLFRQLESLLSDVLADANSLMDAGDYVRAEQILQVIQSVNAGLRGLDVAQRRLQSHGAIASLLKSGDEALETGRILQPDHDNARYFFQQVLALEPTNASALDGMAGVQRALMGQALLAAREHDFELAETWMSEAVAAGSEQGAVTDTEAEIESIKQAYALELEQKAVTAMDSGQFNQADFFIIDLIALGGQQQLVDGLRDRLREVRLYGGLKPGQTFRDELLKFGGTAPELVIIPAGSFRMGSRERSANEEPSHRVTITRGFALGVREVTVGEFSQFVESTAYRTTAEKSGSSSVYNETAGRLSSRSGVSWRDDYRGRKADPELPVLHVSLYDAKAYLQWLSRETGKNYRLPSEAEYEYVAKAGSTGSYWWGEGSPASVVENLTGERDKSPSGREWTAFFENYGDGHWGPAPAGATSDGEMLHPLGVFDISGNVSEWVEDCWHDNYIKAPVDGSAWVNPGCSRRVVRGGYWASAPKRSRAAVRIPVDADKYGPVIGFRIARDL
ncbi:MAG: SUMF1/EgtB/PvdO family nonheme iron enzyme [Xanthomonadales bacterium]|nr:SUMF1/EgtB/PvdO family nonheme iron enzyme [Xanthomonadales bacterium]